MRINKPIRYTLYLLAVYLFIHIAAYALQEKFFFLEEKLHADHQFNFSNSSTSDFEEIFLKMENGNRINGLYFKTKNVAKGDVLYFHGNAGSLDRWGDYTHQFTSKGYNILMIDYQGYGKSEGKASEANFYKDGQKAYDWIRKKTEPENLIIYGRSIGCGVASHIAAQNPAKLIIMETPFNNMQNVVQTRYPFFILPFPLRHRFPNDENLPKIDYPIHIFHGTKDKVVPYNCAIKLKNQFKSGDQFYTVKNAGHNDLINFPAFNETLAKILK